MKRIFSLVLGTFLFGSVFGQNYQQEIRVTPLIHNVPGYEGTSSPQNMCNGIGGGIVVGEINNFGDNNGGFDPVLIKYPESGLSNPVMKKRYKMEGMQSYVTVNTLHPQGVLRKGGYILAGTHYETDVSNANRCFFIRTDPNGGVVWKQTVDYQQFNGYEAMVRPRINQIIQLRDGHLLCIINEYTHTSGTPTFPQHAIVKINAIDGSILWSKVYSHSNFFSNSGNSYLHNYNSVIENAPNEAVIVGSIFNHGYMLRINHLNGSVITTRTLANNNGEIELYNAIIRNDRIIYGGKISSNDAQEQQLIMFSTDLNINDLRSLDGNTGEATIYDLDIEEDYHLDDVNLRNINNTWIFSAYVQNSLSNGAVIPQRGAINLVCSEQGDVITGSMSDKNMIHIDNGFTGLGTINISTGFANLFLSQNTNNTTPTTLSRIFKFNELGKTCMYFNDQEFNRTTIQIEFFQDGDFPFIQSTPNNVPYLSPHFSVQPEEYDHVLLDDCFEPCEDMSFDISTSSGNEFICSNGTLDLIANQNYNYTWILNGTNIGSGSQITINQPGVYYCIATDPNNSKCQYIESIEIEEYASFKIPFNQTRYFCQWTTSGVSSVGLSNDIVGNSGYQGNYSYQWYLNSTPIQNETSFVLDPWFNLPAGTYTLEITTDCQTYSIQYNVVAFGTHTVTPLFSKHPGQPGPGEFTVELYSYDPNNDYIFTVTDLDNQTSVQTTLYVTINQDAEYRFNYSPFINYEIKLEEINKLKCAKRSFTSTHSSTAKIITKKSSTISNNDPLNEITLFPNPANTYFEVKADEVKSLVIFDGQGRIVREEANPQDRKIDIADLKPGMYIVKVNTETETKSIKLVKE